MSTRDIWTLGEKIRALRLHYCMTQLEVGRALGVTNSLVCYWESDSRRPQIRELAKLSSLFHCTIDELTNETAPIYRRQRENQTKIDDDVLATAREFDRISEWRREG